MERQVIHPLQMQMLQELTLRMICLMMTMLYDAKSMPSAYYLKEEMMNGFLIVLVHTIYVTIESTLVLTLH